MSSLVGRIGRGAATPLAVLTAGVLTAGGFGAAAAAPASAATAARPGPTRAPVVLSTGFTMSGFDVAASPAGGFYVGWIANTVSSDASTRAIHLCTVKPGAASCSGKVQVVDSLGDSSASGLRVLVNKAGVVELVWFYESTGGGQIGVATTQGGVLQPAVDAGSAPNNGVLLDAKIAPDNSLWTVAGSDANGIQVRAGTGTAARNVSTPYSVSQAQLAFAGSTPVIATQDEGFITKPAGYTFESHGSWSFHNLTRTWTAGAGVGLAETTSGLRLIAAVPNADYWPVVASWTGSGFSKPVAIAGDHHGCTPSSHDATADTSGRLADVSDVCSSTIAVANLQTKRSAAVVRFPSGGTINSGPPRMATTPRGIGLAVWSVEGGDFDRLSMVPVRLAGLDRTVTKRAAAGSARVTGPVSCLPPINIRVGVKGVPAAGWHVEKQSLTLGHRALRSVLAGAALTAGRTYRLAGHVTFSNGRAAESITRKLAFRACPAP
jgi:hypothetical protein